MRKYFCSLFLGLTVSLLASTPIDNSVDLGTVDVIRHVFNTKYALKEYKGDKFGWDLEKELDILRTGLQNCKGRGSIELQKFFHSTNDFHVGGVFYSTELASLPLEIRECNGRYFVIWLDDTKVNSTGLFGVKVTLGDELVEWDGRPIHDVVNEFFVEEYGVKQGSRTLRELALSYLTRRVGEVGIPLPSNDSVKLTFNQTKTGKTLKKKVFWEFTEELVPPFGGKKQKSMMAKSVVRGEDPFSLLKKMGCVPYVFTQAFVRAKQAGTRSYALGSRRGFLPFLGKTTWESRPECPFFAYIYSLNNGKRVGYLRIPHFDGSDGEIKEFREIIRKFHTSTDMLIIDEMNNPGGSLFYMYAILSSLTTKPIPTMDFCEAITQKEVILAASLASVLPMVKSEKQAVECLEDTTDGYLPTVKLAKQLLNYSKHIINEWEVGNCIASPCPLLGVDVIEPHPTVRYSRPILVLSNGLCFSCADFFPTYLKENKRATVMGQTTAGAGGTVLGPISFPNRYGLDNFTLTQSYALDKKGELLENVGTAPDIYYEVTEKDCISDWSDFAESIRAQAKKMVNQ